jgi:hypothetical protein
MSKNLGGLAPQNPPMAKPLSSLSGRPASCFMTVKLCHALPFLNNKLLNVCVYKLHSAHERKVGDADFPFKNFESRYAKGSRIPTDVPL